MLYIDFEANKKAYKLRLTTREIISLEKKLGCNPLMIFGAGDKVPSITEMVAILHAALQPFHHGITFDAALDIFDAYLQEHVVTDFIPVIIEIYKTSGIIANDKKASPEEAEENEKN